MNLSALLDFIMSQAKKMTMVSALKIETSSGKRFCIDMLLSIAEHPTLANLLDPSVYTFMIWVGL